MSAHQKAIKRIKRYVDRRHILRLKEALGITSVNRIDACNQLIAKLQGSTYLEIGVDAAEVLTRIKAKRKIGVDPKPKPALVGTAQDTNYFSMESDLFFSKYAPDLFSSKPIDVVLVDGLHEYKQALRDVENSLRYLRHDGVIVMHDCNPPSFCRGLPPGEQRDRLVEATSRAGGAWEGDVWKAIVYLRSVRKDLRVFVLDCDHGLGFVTRGAPDNLLSYSGVAIEQMTYDDLARDRAALLNLQPPSFFRRFLEEMQASS